MNLKAIFILFFVLSFGLKAQNLDSLNKTIPLKQDSIKIFAADSLLNDSTKIVSVDSLKPKDDFDSPIKYAAKDSIVFDVDDRVLYIYGEAHLRYEGMDLKAEKIWVDYKTDLIYAEGVQDTNGNWSGTPVFNDNGETYYAERMKFNSKTKKGKIVSAKTKQDEQVLIGDSIRVNADKSLFIREGKFTTCDHDPPHFYITSRKLKVIPKDKIISGPLYMVIEGIPIPIIIPFGFFPQASGKKSGIMLPTYGEALDRGFFLRNLGYYFAINDYMDLKVDGDIFTKGGYRLGLASSYIKRYKFNGNVKLSYAVQKFNEKTDADYSRLNTFNIDWSHNQTISPTARFTASVNAGTSSFFRNTTTNVNDYLKQNMLSSISYNKSFPNTPWSLAVTASSNQQVNDKTISLNLPSISINRNRTFPFQRKEAIGDKRWYENIGLSYNSEIKNTVNNLKDSLLFQPEMMEKLQNGMVHRVGFSTQFKVLKYLNINPRFSFNEYWYLKSLNKGFLKKGSLYNDLEVGRDTVVNSFQNGFTGARDFDFAVPLTTNLYGMFDFKGKRNTKVRHTLTPSISYNYRPDFSKSFWGYYSDVQVDSNYSLQQYSHYEGFIFSGPSKGEQQALSFSMINVIEMKKNAKIIPNDTSTAKKEPVRTRLIDNLGLNFSYNFAADSLKLSPFNMNLRTNILNNLINFNLSGLLDPYDINEAGAKVNKFYWDTHKSLGRITNGSFSVYTSLKSKEKKAVKPQPKELTQEQKEILAARDEYLDFNIPWDLNLGYTLNYNRPNNTKPQVIQNLTASGNISLTEKWKISFNSGFDFVNHKLTFTTFSVHRDLHCWDMSFSWIPFGQRQSYTLIINVKSQTLQDLKLTKRRDWQDRFKQF